MFYVPEFLNPDYYIQGREVSTLIIESGILAFLVTLWTAILSYRASLRKQSAVLFWLGNFSSGYAIWNVLYLSSYSNRDLELPTGTLTAEFANQAHLYVAVILPFLAHQFLYRFFGRRRFFPKLTVYTLLALAALAFLLKTSSYYWALLLSGGFVFGSFFTIVLGLSRFYRTTDDLKMKTRSYFILIGLFFCTLASAAGQLRAENILNQVKLPYVGNILTAILIFFIYQMGLNPRLREVRELMLRGIRVLILTMILAVIFISLLSWVIHNDLELFVFNTAIASFIILSILEPLRKRMDAFFLKRFIVDRFEFEELLKRLPKRLQKARNIDELSHALVEGVRETGRIYQTALFLWTPSSNNYRLAPPSNLTFANTLELDHPWVGQVKQSKQYLLLEHAQELPDAVADSLRDMHSHIVLPLMRGEELLGLWALRTSLRSTNPYTSFSNDEIEALERVSQDVVSVLEQIQHFDSQERQVRLATLGEMSAALAHEIRNPLGAIQGAAQLLKTSPTLQNEEDKECVDILEKEILRMQRTVEQYLSFARKSEAPVLVSLVDLTRAVIQEATKKAEKTQTKLHFSAPSELPSLKTDSLKVEQILFNLIQNACEAFSKNVWIELSLIVEASRIQISVRDDGPGIPGEHLKNIFTPLFTTKKAGSGLGLPICKKMAEALGGDLSVESQPGKGTTFRVLLPLESSNAPAI